MRDADAVCVCVDELLYLCRRRRRVYNLQHASVVPRGRAFVRLHMEVESFFDPDIVHNLQDLQSNAVLPKVVPGLEHRKDLLAALLGKHTPFPAARWPSRTRGQPLSAH